MDMSQRQKDQVARIERLAGVSFNGSTYAGAKSFIKRYAYLESAKDKKLRNPQSSPTPAQVEYIDRIMESGGPLFTGRTRISAACYIEHYRNATPLKMSDAQKRAVSMCRDYAGATFEGQTYEELTEFLNTHMPTATAVYQERKQNEQKNSNSTGSNR